VVFELSERDDVVRSSEVSIQRAFGASLALPRLPTTVYAQTVTSSNELKKHASDAWGAVRIPIEFYIFLGFPSEKSPAPILS
jgi:hypothetical protein